MGDPYRPVRRQNQDFQEACANLSENIEAWRLYRKMSVRQLHFKSDVPVSRLTEIKHAKRADIKFTTLLRIAKALDVTPSVLITTPPPEEQEREQFAFLGASC